MPREIVLKPRKQPRQARSKATVEAIMQAAAQVFCEFGYAEGTTDRVAERAGVSIGSLYQYFPNKDSLLVALAEKHLEEGFGLIHEVLQLEMSNPHSLREMIYRFTDALLLLHSKEPQLHRVLFNEAPLPASFLMEKERREQIFAEKLKLLLMKYPEVRIKDTNLAVYLLVQVTEGLIHSFILFPPADICDDQLREGVVNMLHQYLTSS